MAEDSEKTEKNAKSEKLEKAEIAGEAEVTGNTEHEGDEEEDDEEYYDDEDEPRGRPLFIASVLLAGMLMAVYYTQPLPQWEVIKRFHNLWYSDSNTWMTNTWLGIPARQNPMDAWVIQEIIHEIVPDYIIETGTQRGGSALYWASVLDQVNPNGKIITIDTEDLSGEARKLGLWQQKVSYIIGDSSDARVIADIQSRVKGRKVLVILDSDHSKNHVVEELKGYADLVSMGSYMIVKGTNLNGHPVLKDFGPGPMEAVDEFLAGNDKFEIDRSRERLKFTMMPRGFLKKTK